MICFNFAISIILLVTTLQQAATQSELTPGAYEGDIVLTDSQSVTNEALSNPDDPTAPQNAVVRNERQLWPNAIVPYELDRSLNSQARSAITEAIEDYRRQTCVRFTPRAGEADYVRIFPGRGCFSYIGRTTGPQDMSIGRGCEFKGIVMHEMFHALGRWHEQSRPDRDQFVQILTNNIQNGMESNFEITNPAFVTTQGVPYDSRSIMHYSSTAFSRNGNPTILPRDSSIRASQLGQREGLTNLDLLHVRTLYCGGGGSSVSWSAWNTWSRCSQTCNGGTRSRTRRCNGGTTCDGSNIKNERCNTASCPVVVSWNSWSTWSDCSQSCGGGRMTRTRKCLGGNICLGRRAQFGSCNDISCPQAPMWATWGSWSSCSTTCQGGFRQRTRRCKNGNNCPGTNVESNDCNINITCEITNPNGEWSSWSKCSAQCGGGARYRVRNCEDGSNNCQTAKQACNTGDCVPEPELRGLRYRGCWYLNVRNRRIGSIDGTTSYLRDDASKRIRPVSKCGTAVQRRGYDYFGVTEGICVTGSNNLEDYQYYASSLCRDGKGAYTQRYGGWFLIDVYEITNDVSFSDSVMQLNASNATTELMTTGTGAGHAHTYNLALLISAILTVIALL